MVDKLGKRINLNDYIIYTTSKSGRLTIGKVMAIVSEKKIAVIGTESGRKNGPYINSKVGFLTHPERIVIITADNIPQNYKSLLDSFKK